MRRLLILIALACGYSFVAPDEAPAQVRDVVQACWSVGAAVSEASMSSCVGRPVPPAAFSSCVSGGPCFGEAPVPPQLMAGAPFCGAVGLPFCPVARHCGQPGSITCPLPFPVPYLTAPACGSAPFPACAAPVRCGMAGTFACVPLPAPGFAPAVLPFNPSLNVALPATPAGGLPQGGIGFAVPPMPNLAELQSCHAQSAGEQAFYRCMVGRALPAPYRITAACISNSAGNYGAALACSTGDARFQQAYRRYQQVEGCFRQGNRNDAQIAACIAEPNLGQNERRYLQCIMSNSQQQGQVSWGPAAACAVAGDLNAEWQIAVSCAVNSGGEPLVFAGCTGGQLMTREISKCWSGGIGTSNGCFGPNNEFRRWADQMNQYVQRTFGPNSVAAQVYGAWHNNVLAPGPNHEVVRFLNNGLRDIQNGPGPNNEFVRLGSQMEGGVRSVAKRFGVKW